jgi:light-harvesting complex II chlorophyll a/b binding protein 7
MLAAPGCLIPEALSLGGVELGEPVWWKVGAAKLQGDLTLNWGGIEVRGGCWCACARGSRTTHLLAMGAPMRHRQARTTGAQRATRHRACQRTRTPQGFRIAGKQGIGIIAACQVVLMGGPEYAR